MPAASAAARAQQSGQSNQSASAGQPVVRYHSLPVSTCILQEHYEQLLSCQMETSKVLALVMPMSALSGLTSCREDVETSTRICPWSNESTG